MSGFQISSLALNDGPFKYVLDKKSGNWILTVLHSKKFGFLLFLDNWISTVRIVTFFDYQNKMEKFDKKLFS
jgi:hypothetical protein